MRELRIILSVFILIIADIYAQPKLELNIKNTYDFGLVKLNQSPLRVKVKVYNSGDSDLIIDKVKPDCGCTTAPLDKNIISPNDSAVLSISLDISSYKGLINKSITIYSNSKPTPISVITLIANVFRSLNYITLNYFNFGEPKISKDYIKKVIIKNSTDKKFEITSIENPYDFIKLKILNNKIIKPRGYLNIELTLNCKKEGPFSFNVFLETNCPDTPELVISGWGVAKK